MTPSISPAQRFSRIQPCPVCQGYPSLPRGKGIRCTGYRSEDGRYAFCTREDLAGNLSPTRATPPSYKHHLVAPCRCGVDHRNGAAVSTATPSSGGAPPRRRKGPETVYPSISSSGITIAEHHRVDYDNGDKSMWWERDGHKGLDGYPLADLPLYNLPQLVAADPATPVIVTEGEKAATALRTAGVLAVGTVTGDRVRRRHWRRCGPWRGGRSTCGLITMM